MNDNNPTVPNETIQLPQVEQQPANAQLQTKKSGKGVVFLVLIMGLFVLADYGIYSWQHGKVQQQNNNATHLNEQITKVQSQINGVKVLNNGKSVPSSNTQNTSTGTVSLASGKVTFTLPNGWVKATNSNSNVICSGDSIDSKVICEDIATVLPSEFNKNDVNNAFSVELSVFQKTDNKNAKNWIDTSYDSETSNTGEPQAIDQSAASINGYDAFTFTRKYSDANYPTTIIYGVVKGSYAVVIRSTYMTIVNPSGTQGGGINKDYSKYLPDIKNLVYSVNIGG